MLGVDKLLDETALLVDELGIDAEVRMRLSSILTPDFLKMHEADFLALTKIETAEDTWKALTEQYKDIDEDGFIILAINLASANITRRDFKKAGLADQIFLDTMDCFPRFLSEDLKNKGKICFTRSFWTWRQLAKQIFRLGALEFELKRLNTDAIEGYSKDDVILSVHIPSDAILDRDSLDQSYEEAVSFFKDKWPIFSPDGMPKLFYCHTWLLAPNLIKLLPEHSRIKQFASDYDIISVHEDSDGFYEWLFGGIKDLDQLPQTSSLQKNVVAHLRAGGKLGEAAGVKPFIKSIQR